ncbi:hypothetical protein GCWU000342_01377 [Shuttleworthella satelles DSM 14600]|uniref:Uncharacterized protein n=1 Tax=Shuttleworthella satelles DSM 14600 TaxID=626523 RepID=C4GBS5_9FIRM|nr:hypothetical protein GCWU000342_01377 [Shuttleworthia satelles DSM 14600]
MSHIASSPPSDLRLSYAYQHSPFQIAFCCNHNVFVVVIGI